MLGLAGEPLLGGFLLGELLLTPLNMLARSQLCPGLCTVLVGSLLRSVGMEGQDSGRDGRRSSKEQLPRGSTPSAGEQQRWRHI